MDYCGVNKLEVIVLSAITVISRMIKVMVRVLLEIRYTELSKKTGKIHEAQLHYFQDGLLISKKSNILLKKKFLFLQLITRDLAIRNKVDLSTNFLNG